MSYAAAPAPGPKTRPGVVATASLLLYAAAVLLLVSAGLGLMQIGPAKESADIVYADQPDVLSAVGSVLTIFFIAIGVIYLLLAIGLVVLGLLVGKGKQPARVITWVVAGLAVLCLGCSTASAGLTGGLGAGSMGGSGSAAESEELARLVAEKTPTWVGAASTAVVVISLIMMIAVIILLALPASNDYFRKEQQVWVPPTAPWPADPNNFPPPPPPGATL